MLNVVKSAALAALAIEEAMTPCLAPLAPFWEEEEEELCPLNRAHRWALVKEWEEEQRYLRAKFARLVESDEWLDAEEEREAIIAAWLAGE